MPDEVQPIPPEKAREILDNAIRERLGEDWDDPEYGWYLLSGHDYMARLTRGNKNIDFYVDLLGNVTVEEKELDPAQQVGRIVVWLFMLFSLIIAISIARIVGIL